MPVSSARLETDAVVTMRDGHWLRIPLGKLHNDRYIPLHPHLVELLADWSRRHDDHGTGLLLTRDGRPLTVSGRPDRPAASPTAPGSGTSTRTSCGTPSPPKPSTAACGSKRSARCSATGPCG